MDYPDEKDLERLRTWNFREPGWLDFAESLWAYPESVNRTMIEDPIEGPILVREFVTGGWSGNEDILSAMGENFVWWSQLWHASYRGGKIVFEDKDLTSKPSPS